MKRTEELLASLDKSWNEFSQAWKKTRKKASEKSVHDLRVNTRRLIAALELGRVLSRRASVAGLQRRFKKVLKRMGALRDVQVQLAGLSQIGDMSAIVGFERGLERIERKEIGKVRGELKRGRKQRLADAFEDARSEFSRLYDSMDDDRFVGAVERVLSSRRKQFLKAKHRFQRLHPLNEDALHEMRIALKKLRYLMEAAGPVLDSSAKEPARQMQAFQKLMGDSRDVEMLRLELEKWARKKGKQIAVVPAVERLQHKRETLLKKILESSDRLERSFQTQTPKPVAETTQVLKQPAVAAIAGDSGTDN